jgi:tetratricopeptide (TPR) repeat protein
LQGAARLADHVGVTTAAPPSSPWLFGPRSDLLLGCGLLYTLVFGLFLAAGPELRSAMPAWVGAALLLLLGTPHYGATLVRVYEHRQDRRGYVLFSVWATLAVIAFFVAGLWATAIGSFLVTLYLTWSPWHYTGQNYGLAVMFLRRGGVPLDPHLKRWLYLSFLLSFLLVFVGMHAAHQSAHDLPAGYSSLGVGFTPLGIPQSVVGPLGIGLLLAYLAALARCAWGFRQAPRRALLPVVLLAMSQVLWFSLPFGLQAVGLAPKLDVLSFEFRTYYFIWIAAAHSLQYLWVTAYYARQSGKWQGQLPNYLRVLAAGAAVWTLPALVFGPQALGPLAFDQGLGLLIAAAVNLHHFILDGAIWKLRGRIAEVLIRSRKETGEEESRWPWLRPLIWAGCAGLLVVNVLGLGGDHWFVREIEAERYQRAGEVADALRWAGRDRASWRLRFGERLLRERNFAEARKQLRLSDELRPSAKARVLVGVSYEAQSSWPQAVEAYESALDIAMNDAGRKDALGRAAGAWISAGEPARAVPLLEAALATDPSDAALRALLEEAAEAAGPRSS